MIQETAEYTACKTEMYLPDSYNDTLKRALQSYLGRMQTRTY